MESSLTGIKRLYSYWKAVGDKVGRVRWDQTKAKILILIFVSRGRLHIRF
jgi:hypothetical protein